MKELEYVQVGDYLLPALELDDIPTEPIGKYGLMRRRYLEEQDKVQFTVLQLKCELYSHLSEIDKTAKRQVNQFIEDMLKVEPAPDKTSDPMGWVGHMENLKARAEEIVTRELIFA